MSESSPAPGTSRQVTRARKAAFLKALGAWPNVSAAARAAGVNRSQPYEWRADDQEFAAAWDAALQDALDQLEQTAFELATGVKQKMVVSAGQVLGHEEIYSEGMLSLLLKAHRPERYKDRVAQELSGKDGAPIAFTLEIPPPAGGDEEGGAAA